MKKITYLVSVRVPLHNSIEFEWFRGRFQNGTFEARPPLVPVEDCEIAFFGLAPTVHTLSQLAFLIPKQFLCNYIFMCADYRLFEKCAFSPLKNRFSPKFRPYFARVFVHFHFTPKIELPITPPPPLNKNIFNWLKRKYLFYFFWFTIFVV